MTVIYVFAMLVGLGGWLPAPTSDRRSWDGFVFLQSWLLFIVLLYLGNVVFGIALSRLWIVFSVLAALGTVFRICRTGLSVSGLLAQSLHPVWVLMALTCVVIYAHDGIEYLPFPGDETASWLRLARQIFLVDAYWSPAVDYHLGAYTDGWPLFIAFTNSIHGFYDDGHGVAVAFVMQLGLIAATFDVVRHIVDQEKLKIDDWMNFAIGWAFILSLLAVEASWILMPTFQLIDEPLIFAFLGCFLIALLGLYNSCNRLLIALYLGLAIAAAYLLKIAAIALVPAALILLVAFLRTDERGLRDMFAHWNNTTTLRLLGFGLAIFAPLLVVNLSWEHFKIGVSCTASPIQLLTSGTGPAAQQPLSVAVGFIKATFDFLSSYKLPLSLLAAASLVAGLFYNRSRWLIVAFGGFVALYIVALFFGYVSCFDVIEMGKFEALPRYLRTPVRLAHYLGLVIGLITILRFDTTRQLVQRWLSERSIQTTLAITIVLLFGWQARSVDRSLDDMRTRDYQDPELRTMILSIQAQATALAAEIERRRLDQPSVSLIAQGGYGAEFDLAMYFGIKSRPDGRSNFIYVPQRPFFWANERRNIFTAVVEPEKLETFWRGFDIIWSYRTDEWTRNTLRQLVGGQECGDDPEQYFLFRNQVGTFECVKKLQ